MNDPTRLRDGSDAHMRVLLRYAQTQDRPSAVRVEALTARVLAELAAPDASTTPSDPAPAPVSASGTGWLAAVPTRSIAGLAAALLLGAGAYRLIARTPERSAPPPAAVVQPSVVVPTGVPVVTPAVTPAAQPPAPVVVPAPAGVEPRRAKPAGVRQAPAVRDDPAAEVTLLQRARRLVAREPRAALALVAQHRREFPQGVFAEEREALAVEALQRSGQHEQAAARLQALLARHPRSSYRERLRALLADTRE